jgi:hypothetical protein
MNFFEFWGLFIAVGIISFILYISITSLLRIFYKKFDSPKNE